MDESLRPIEWQSIHADESEEFPPAFYEKLLDSLYDGVYFVNKERRIQYWNKGAEHLTGYSASEVIGRHCFENFLMHVNDEECSLCIHGCPLASTLADGERRADEVYLRHKSGYRIPVSVRVAPIMNNEREIIGAVEVFSDLTAKKTMERRVGELESLAFLDSLTGVSNRRYTELKVRQAIQEFEQFGRTIGLMMIDVDYFKQVNDAYGHAIGDEALRALCKTLTHNLRTDDAVGRWGGEEFLVITTDVNSATLRTLGERFRMLIAESAVPISDGHLQITVSLGATLMQQGDTAASVIKRADELMYKSKLSGRNRLTIG